MSGVHNAALSDFGQAAFGILCAVLFRGGTKDFEQHCLKKPFDINKAEDISPSGIGDTRFD